MSPDVLVSLENNFFPPANHRTVVLVLKIKKKKKESGTAVTVTLSSPLELEFYSQESFQAAYNHL